MTDDLTQETVNLLRSLKHPLRVKIMMKMTDGEPYSPSSLAEALGEPIGNVSYHMRLLLENRQISLVRTAPRRGAVEHFYRLKPRFRTRVPEVVQALMPPRRRTGAAA